MSTPNSDRIGINEQGEVIINDPELASVTQELSDEELENIAGGMMQDDIINESRCTVNQCKPA